MQIEWIYKICEKKKIKFGNSEKTAKNLSNLAADNWVNFKVTTLTLRYDLDFDP